MANPFYIPKRQSRLIPAAQLALGFAGLQQRGRESTARIEEMKRDRELKGQAYQLELDKATALYGSRITPGAPPGIEDIKAETARTAAGTQRMTAKTAKDAQTLARDKFLAENPGEKPFVGATIDRFIDGEVQHAAKLLRSKDPEITKAVIEIWQRPRKVLEPYLNDDRVKKGTVLDELIDPVTGEKTELYNELYDSVIGGFKEQFEKGRLKNSNFGSTPLGQYLLAGQQQMEEDKAAGGLINQTFGDVIRKREADAAALLPKEGALSTLGKLVQEYNSLSQDSPMRDIYEERMEKEAAQTGERITVGPNGEVTVYKGPIGGMGPEPTTKITTDLQETITEGQFNLDKLDLIEANTRPEFLTYRGQIKQALLRAGEKAEIVNERQAQYAAEYSTWKAQVENYMFLWRKFITGVAGGPAEMKRIEKSIINTDVDSLSTFKGKSVAIRELTKAAMARSKFFLENFNVDISKLSPEERVRKLEEYGLEKFGFEEIEEDYSTMTDADLLRKLEK